MRVTRYGIDYDLIADTYDDNPARRRGPDPDFLEFISERETERPLVLDIGCGTGIQLAADEVAVPEAVLVGLDPFINMLTVARRKSASIIWVQGDGMDLPFGTASFDYISNQFSYHHMEHPDLMIAEAYRVCRPGGRLVLSNMTPYAMQDTALYEWFPETLPPDLAAHPEPDALQRFAEAAGFTNIRVDTRVVGGPASLTNVAAKYAHKASCSQLNALPQALFERRLARLRQAAAHEPLLLVPDHIALMRLLADKPG
ncbi:MAG: hypothetical protein QOF51_3320 [Chloroflexota bacterium]|jgi:SAM-dependent methyltransferase|nr:hypothetical protein [Chloroflexota bacterium]